MSSTGGDSAGGNLALAALALLREQGKLSILPLALTLLSPAVDMSDSSVFGRGPDKVSNHIDSDGFASGDGPSSDPADAACRDGRAQAADSSPAVQESCSTSAADGQAAGAAATAGNRIGAANEASHSSKVLQGRAASHSMDGREYEAATAATIRSSGFADVSTANAMLQDALQQAKQQLQRHRMQQQLHQHPDITAAGFSSPCQLLRGLVSEVYEGFRAHGSRRGTQAAAADGYFDYLPRSSIADDLHHYLHVGWCMLWFDHDRQDCDWFQICLVGSLYQLLRGLVSEVYQSFEAHGSAARAKAAAATGYSD